LDDREKIIAQIERNYSKSLHAPDLEAGTEKTVRHDQVKLEKLTPHNKGYWAWAKFTLAGRTLVSWVIILNHKNARRT
jgi:hypothetical protein